MGYECLLTGLPDLKAGANAPMKQDALLEVFSDSLSASDMEQLRLLLVSPEDEMITRQMEAYDDTIIGQPAWWEEVRDTLSDEDIRTALVYEYGIKKGCKFVKDWFRYNQDLNNILAAAICRKHGFDVRKVIVGQNEVAQILRRNLPQKDFGLGGVIDNLPEIMALLDIDNLMEREKRLDAMRFAWLEQKTLFVNFSLDNVLAYWLMCSMLNRWSVLTVEQGEQVFRDMVADMKKGVQLD